MKREMPGGQIISTRTPSPNGVKNQAFLVTRRTERLEGPAVK